MRKWILMLVCVLTLSALSVCFAEDSDNSGEVTAQQSYVNEAITVTSETSADAPSQSPVLRDVAYMTQGGRQLIIKLYDIDSDYDVSRLAEPDFEEGDCCIHIKIASRCLTIALWRPSRPARQ